MDGQRAPIDERWFLLALIKLRRQRAREVQEALRESCRDHSKPPVMYRRGEWLFVLMGCVGATYAAPLFVIGHYWIGSYFLLFSIASFGGILECHQEHRADVAAYKRHHAKIKLAAVTQAVRHGIGLPRPVAAEGYLYVIRFSTDTVKVGQTGDLRRRFSEHRRDADAYGVTIVDFWVSAPHANYLDTEVELIHLCARVRRVKRAKREYFTGVPYDVVLGFTANLPYDPQPQPAPAGGQQ